MQGADYPIEHLNLMVQVAEQLRLKSIQLLSHEYMYEAFGSWWFTFNRKGKKFRLVFDGRDRSLSLEKPLDEPIRRSVNSMTWLIESEEIPGKRIEEVDDSEILEKIVDLITQA